MARGHRRKASSVKISVSREKSFLEMRPLCEPCTECGKFRYITRKAAKAARRRTNRHDSMSVYRCGDYWHIGHTPHQIRQGYAERSNHTNTFEAAR